MTESLSPLDSAVLIPRAKIRPNPDQARKTFDVAELANLRESVREHGLLQPIAVRYEPSRYDGTAFVITAGERRYRASEGVLDELPCVLLDVDEAKGRELSLVENLQRRDLTAYEEAAVVRDLMEAEGLTQKQVAMRFHKSETWVNNRIAFLKTGTDVQTVGARVPKKLSALLLTDRVKTPDVRAQLLADIEHGEIPFVQVKTRVEAHVEAVASQKRADEFRAKAQTAPDTQTQKRQRANARGESSSMSRGQHTIGPNRAEANREVTRALSNLEAWVKLCDETTKKRVEGFARRILRGDLAR